MSDRVLLTGADVEVEQLDDWRLLFAELRARFTIPDFASALRLVDAIGAAAEAADHHPDLDIRFTKVTCTLSTHSAGGITQKDLDLAAELERVAAG